MEKDLFEDIKNDPVIMEKIKNDRYAQNVYAALCNMQWQPAEVFPILKDEYWSCTWRSAGGIVARLQDKGDYMNWYCSGMGGLATYDIKEGEEHMANLGFVPEGTVTDEIREDLLRLGWVVVNSSNDYE